MKNIILFLFFAAVGLSGCKTAPDEERTELLLSVTDQELSKTDALTAGDEVAVYARIDGTETYFVEAAKFTTGADGKTLSTTPAVHYPETKQAVRFYAYFPYHTGTFSVPTDQSTVAALKQADLCWATASSTPVSIVPLTFRHLFARLIVQTNQPTAKIACLVVPSGVLNAATAQFTLNGSKSEVYTTGTELIIPAQPLNRLVLSVSGVEYSYDGAISLLAGQTTTINLTLHPSTQTATLSGSSATNWTTTLATAATTQSVLNTLKLHWPNVAAQASTVDKMVLTIQDLTDRTTADYTVQGGIAYADGVFTLPFSSSVLHYPYQITQIRSYASTTEVLPMVNVFSGPMVYKSGVQTVGVLRNPINPPTEADYVVINGLKWAKGPLIATNSTSSGMNGCKIGKPEDPGLYFQFGSLVGWRNGNVDNGGTGQGIPSYDETLWGNTAKFVFVEQAIVWPSLMNTLPTAWPQNDGSVAGDRTTFNDYYFNYNAPPYSSPSSNFSTYFGSTPESYASKGIGDPCTYYLGGLWRIPTWIEYQNLKNTSPSSWTSYNGIQGRWFGGNKIFFAANGCRNLGGLIVQVFVRSRIWTQTISGPSTFYTYNVWPTSADVITSWSRSFGLAARCVSN